MHVFKHSKDTTLYDSWSRKFVAEITKFYADHRATNANLYRHIFMSFVSRREKC